MKKELTALAKDVILEINIPRGKPPTKAELERATEYDVRTLRKEYLDLHTELSSLSVDRWILFGQKLHSICRADKEDGKNFKARYSNTPAERADEDRLPFSAQTGDWFMRISSTYEPYISDIRRKLPGSYNTLHLLSYIPEEKRQQLIEDGSINPAMSRQDASKLKREHAPAKRRPTRKKQTGPKTLDNEEFYGDIKAAFSKPRTKKQRATEVLSLMNDLGISFDLLQEVHDKL